MRGSHRRVEEEVAAGDGAQHGGVDALQHHRVAQLVAQVLHALELPLKGADLLARVFVAFVSKPERAVLLLQGSDPRAQGADGLRPLHDGPAERSARSRGPAHMRVRLRARAEQPGPEMSSSGWPPSVWRPRALTSHVSEQLPS